MQVLHVMDPLAAGRFALDGLRRLLDEPDDDESAETLLLGGTDAERLAQQSGVRSFDRLHPPIGRAEAAVRSFRRFIASRGGPDLIHAWSPGASRLAATALPGTPRVVTPTRPPRANGLPSRIPKRPNAARGCALFPSRTLRDGWFVQPGAMDRLIRPARDPLIARFPVEQSHIDKRSRLAQRRAWGVSEETFLIALLDGANAQPNAWTFSFLLGAAALAGRTVTGVAPPRAADLERAQRFAHALGRRWELRVEPLTTPALACCDLAAITDAEPNGPQIAALAEAMALRVPVVAFDTPAARELTGAEDDAAWLSTGRRPIDLASQLLAALDQPQERARRAELAARRVQRLCDHAAWVQTTRRAYERALAPTPKPDGAAAATSPAQADARSSD